MTMTVSITCDECGTSAETSTSYDAGANEIDGVLDDGWAHDGEQDLCPSCRRSREKERTMKMQVVTTITSLIDIDTFETTHDAQVEGEAGVPESIARAAAIGGCRAILNNFGYDSVERASGPEEGDPDASPAP